MTRSQRLGNAGLLAFSLVVVLGMAGPGSEQRRPVRTLVRTLGTQCPDGVGIAAPSAPNYCTELIATPDLDGVSGALELGPAATPFGVAVERDGRERYRLAVDIDGLPPARTLGPFSTYVAWASTLSMDSVVKLGEVGNGHTPLRELAYSQFRVLVTAESSAGVRRRSGRIVLRGTSPSTRLLAHRDLTQPFAPGQVLGTRQSATPGEALEAGSPAGMPAMALGWRMPPAGPGPGMPAAMRALRPQVEAWKPARDLELGTLPPARPREVRTLRDGDTLALTATVVRRTIAGRTFASYAYDGQIPGPLLLVAQGSTVIVHYRNDTDLPSSVHWHGVRLDNAADGADGVTQDAVAPGGAFTYRVHFPDAGLYWYHAHHREDIAQPLGLFGNILVRARTDRGSQAGPGREEVLAIGDLLIDSAGPFPWGAGAPTHALMGRFGTISLVNGAVRPVLTEPRGAVVRFYLSNVATARPYNLSFGEMPVKVIGSDGGRYAREMWASSVPVVPAERYVVDVRFPRAGDVPLTNRVEALNHATGTLYPEVDTLAIVHVSEAPAGPDASTSFGLLRDDRGAATELARYRAALTRPVDRELQLRMHVRDLPPAVVPMLTGVSVPVDWNDGMPMMNWALTPREVTWVLRDPATGAENMDIAWRFHQGDVIKLRLSNDATTPHAMDHSMHIHGQRFLVASRNGVPNPHLVWKDTVLIPAGETVDLVVDLANPGRWLTHCHIAEHMGAGMMMVMTVEPRSASTSPTPTP